MSAIQQMMIGSGQSLTLMQAITAAGLTSNLKLALDAGDASSYTSGEKWLDQSGNGYDFFLGTDATGTKNPNFTGSAGNRSAYFTNGGGPGVFKYDTSNEVWMNNLHKNNATFTIFSVVYVNGSDGTPQVICCGTQGLGGVGIFFRVESTSIDFNVIGSSGTAISKVSGAVLASDKWHFSAVSINEATGAGGGFLYTDGAYVQVAGSDTFDSTYSSPSAASAAATMEIWSGGNEVDASGSSSMYAMFAAWDTALSKTQLDTLYYLLRNRYAP